LPFTTRVVVVTVAPDPPDVTTDPGTCGPVVVCVPLVVAPVEVLADVAAEEPVGNA